MSTSIAPLIAALRKSGDFSDITLTCQDEEFQLHKAIEAQSGILKADAFDVETVQRMIDFLYTGNYDVKFPSPAPGAKQLILSTEPECCSADITAPIVPGPMTKEKAVLLCHVRVNAIGNYYDIQPLCALANSFIEELFQANWSVQSFPDVAAIALRQTGDQALRKILTSTAAAHISELAQSEDFKKLTTDNDFVVDVLRACAHIILGHEAEVQSLQKGASMHAQDASKAQSILDDVDKCHDKLKNTARCRNCSVSFGAYIQRTSKCTLRCGGCGCRHT
ncbi:hypothetical protein QQX98_011522 [Neonectria punicea]|uniref:BTB domain-containing protein n=1 Tax=Neonectria punicea TaxID=979145 RepID=A0ABR1GLH3_9HYPO